jgi:hypothetical protein
MSFIRRWLSQREQVPTSDADLEAGPASLSSASAMSSSSVAPPSSASHDGGSVELREQQDEGMVVIMRPAATESSANGAAASTVTGTTTNVSPERALITTRLAWLRRASQVLLGLTILQVMSTLGTEHIHFLSLFSIFVPWTGYEGAKEMNPAYVRVFYWGCWIMIPANFFHYLSFDEFTKEILASNLEDNLRRELVFNHALFNGVTIIIMTIMIFCIGIVRQLNWLVYAARLSGDTDSFVLGTRMATQTQRHTGPLSPTEIAAIPALKLGAEDLTVPGSGDKEVCVICQDEYEVNDLAKRLTCRHMFHATCIDAWLERSSSCPNCNGDVRAIV